MLHNKRVFQRLAVLTFSDGFQEVGGYTEYEKV